MKVLFLDIDGVLNCVSTVDRINGCLIGMEPEKVAVLNAILESTGAQVVVSSSWRKAFALDEIQGFLAARGFIGKLLDKTGGSDAGNRGEEIYEWLRAHPETSAYVILDDTWDAGNGHPEHRFVKTNWAHGLTEAHIGPAVDALTREI